jgi:hypothetical protein
VTGFARGDRVLAFGRVKADEGVAQLEAAWLFGGTREQWLAQAAGAYSIARVVPWVLWALAIGCAGLAAALRRGL